MSPINTNPLQALDTVFAELYNYLTEFEQDKCTIFVNSLSKTNPTKWTMKDSFSQFRILLGSERYDQVTGAWARARERRMG